MTDFAVFADALLTSLAVFLWSEPIRWVIASLVLVLIVKIIVMIMRTWVSIIGLGPEK